MSRGGTLSLAGLAAAAVLLLPAGAGAESTWRLEQPPPPEGAPFKVPLGAPGDLRFWKRNRGLLTVEGNDTIPRGIFSWDGREWHQLATVCGGPGDTAKIAWAAPTEFWVVSEPSLPRRGSGLALCRFKDGEVVGSWSTRVDDADPFRQMTSATCSGSSNCWFGGVGSQDALGERVGAFHLHWNGSDLRTVYGPQGRGVTDLRFHRGTLFESTLVGRSAENTEEPVDLADPEPVPSLLHRRQAGTFVNDPFELAPLLGVPDDGTELLALDSDGTDLWAVGGGAASSSGPPAEGDPRGEGGAVERPPIAARLVGEAFQELSLSGAEFGPTDRFGDVAAIPGAGEALATVVPFAERRSVNSKATVARIAADGTTTTTRLPLAGAGRGSAAQVSCPAADECWMVTQAGWIFRYSDGGTLPRDDHPAFQGTIEFRPNEAAEQFIPDQLPIDDSQLFAPPPAELDPTAEPPPAKVRRLPPLLRKVRTRLRRGLRLVVAFTVTRRARVQLLAKRGRRTVGRSRRRVFAPGRRRLTLRLSRKRYPTRLAFRAAEIKRRR